MRRLEIAIGLVLSFVGGASCAAPANDSGYEDVATEQGALATNEQKLTAADAANGDEFGDSLAVSGDRILVGIGLDNVDGPPRQGSAEVFLRTGTSWSPEARLIAADGADNDTFGRTVALMNKTALVGAAQKGGIGAVYYFKRHGSTWPQTQKLVPADGGQSGELFGSSLALDGDTLVIGSDGLARVFTRTDNVWSEQQKITLPEGAFENGFGRCALHGDTLVIGSSRDVVGSNAEQGSVYVYERTGTTFDLVQRIVATDGQPNDHFGNTVAISGRTVLVATDSTFYRPTESGFAYVFVRSSGSFVQQAKLVSPDGAAQDAFGLVVALRGDLALIGASGHEHAGLGTNTGSAYLFQRSDSTWTPIQELMATDPMDNARFGAPVAVSPEYAVSSAPYFGAGAAYVFDL